jgi:hypothetical protein
MSFRPGRPDDDDELDDQDAFDSDEDSNDEDQDDESSSDDTPEVDQNSRSDPRDKEIAELKKRLAGQSRKINQLTQSHQMTQAQRQAIENERNQAIAAFVQQQVQGLPPEEQQAEMARVQRELGIHSQMSQLQQQNQMLMQVAGQAALMDIAQRTGVDMDELIRIRDEDGLDYPAIDKLAQRMSILDQKQSAASTKQQRTDRRETRRSRGQDDFDRPRNVVAPKKKPKTIDEAVQALLSYGTKRR